MAGHEFKRKDSLFSLCGLNCNLCPSLVRGVCPGCQAGSHCASVCPFAPCSAQHGDVTYCFECGEFPCSHYDGVDEHDSLISHRNQFKDIQKAQTMGMEKYHEEQIAKRKVLDRILKEYDDGSNDVYFCMVVNLLELDDLKSILKQADESTGNMDLNDKHLFIKALFEDCGDKRGIELKMRHDGYYM